MSDDLVILTTAGAPFEAHSIAAVLAEREIDATVLDTADADVPLEHAYRGVPVMVRRADLDRARAALAEDAVDWDAVDVGEREDDLPLRPPGRTLFLARMALLAAAAVFGLVLLWGVARFAWRE